MNFTDVLCLSKNLALENSNYSSHEKIIINYITRQRTQISGECEKILKLFEKGISVKTAIKKLSISTENIPVFINILDNLVDSSILIHAKYSEQEAFEKTLQVNPFIQPKNSYADCPFVYHTDIPDWGIVFCGIPIDVGTTRIPGTRYGPDKLRDVSNYFFHYDCDIFTKQNRGWYDISQRQIILKNVPLVDVGNIIIEPGEDPQKLYDRFLKATNLLTQENAVPFFLGGDHSISAPIIKSLCNKFGDISVIHFDAHTDLAYWNKTSSHHHGNVMSKVLFENHKIQLYQIGIRATTEPNYHDNRCHLIHYSQTGDYSKRNVIDKIPRNKLCYLSIDVDVLDPIYVSATGTPVPFGMSPNKLLEIISLIADQNRIIGIDIVEYLPEFDNHDLTANLLVHLIISLLGRILSNPTLTK